MLRVITAVYLILSVVADSDCAEFPPLASAYQSLQPRPISLEYKPQRPFYAGSKPIPNIQVLPQYTAPPLRVFK